MISVVLCTYNGQQFIVQQLLSILDQSRQPDEIIIVDDCSSDTTVSIITKLLDTTDIPVHMINNSTNQGVVASFQIGLLKAKGDWVFCADQDDVWRQDKIHNMLSRAESSAAKDKPYLAYSDAKIIDKDDQLIDESYMKSQRLRLPAQKPYHSLSVINCIPGCTMLINRQLCELTVPFPEQVIMHDWWLALTAATVGSIEYHDEPLIEYRLHSDNTWGLDTNAGMLNKIRLNKLSILGKIRNNFLRTVYQANALSGRLASRGNYEPPTQWLQLIDALSSRGIKRLKPFIAGNIKRQGLLRWVSYLVGALLSINCKIRAK